MPNNLKIRVWDKKEQRMIYPDEAYREGKGMDYYIDYLLMDMNGNIMAYTDDDGGKSGLWEHSYEVNVVKMLATPRVDRNRNIIYEGDILKTYLKYPKDRIDDDKLDRFHNVFPLKDGFYVRDDWDLVEVKFGEYDNKQGYEEQDEGIGFYTQAIANRDTTNTITNFKSFMGWNHIDNIEKYLKENPKANYVNEVEIAGNIYENPELMNEVK